MALISESTRNKLLTAAVIVGAGEKIVDLLTRGRVTQAEGRILAAVFKKAIPMAGRAVVGAVPQALGTARLIAMRHPYVAAGALIYVGVTEREKIRALLEQGYDIIEERLPTPAPPSPGVRPTLPGFSEPIQIGGMARKPVSEYFAPALQQLVKQPRKPSSFNKAVSKGMKAIKGSTSYGKRGVITNTKKAFALVTKVASAKKKKKKAPKSGIRRKVWNAIGRLR